MSSYQTTPSNIYAIKKVTRPDLINILNPTVQDFNQPTYDVINTWFDDKCSNNDSTSTMMDPTDVQMDTYSSTNGYTDDDIEDIPDAAVSDIQHPPTSDTENQIESDDQIHTCIKEPDTDSNHLPHQNPIFRVAVKKSEHLVCDRISFRRKNATNDKQPVSVNLKYRLNDSFVPQVNRNDFISDSDSDEDSDEDYDTREYPPWHRTLGWNRNPSTQTWPKPRKFGYSDKLKLEKRIKKICQRDHISFTQVQEIFSNKKRGQLRFFQKIGKAFPDVPLYRLTKICKETYHKNRNNSPWKIEEIQQLEELVKIYGKNAEKISQCMNRSPKNINDFFFGRRNNSGKVCVAWSKEEDEKLAKAFAIERQKNHNNKISYRPIEELFKGQRSAKQIYARCSSIAHRVRPDGTLVPNRKPTLDEELDYLKSLLNQVNTHNLIEESQLNFAKDRGFVKRLFYLQQRSKIPGFEAMSIKDILNKLIENHLDLIQNKSLLSSESED